MNSVYNYLKEILFPTNIEYEFRGVLSDPAYLKQIEILSFDKNNIDEILAELKKCNNKIINNNFNNLEKCLYEIFDKSSGLMEKIDYILIDFDRIPAIQIKQTTCFNKKKIHSKCYGLYIKLL